MGKVRPIGTIVKLLFKAAYPFGKKKVNDLFVDGTFGDKAAIGALNAVDDSVDVLSDNDPENKIQLNQVWVGYLRETLLPAIGDEVQPVFAIIKNDVLEALIVSIAGKIVDATYLLLDDIKNNPEQLKAYSEEYLKGDEFRMLVTAFLKGEIEKNIKDEGLQGFFLVAIEGLFNMLQGKDPLQNIEIDVKNLTAFVA